MCVVAGQNVFLGPTIPFTSSGILFRISSFAFNTCNVLFLSDTSSKEAVFPMRSPRSESSVPLVASRPEDSFIHPTDNSILGVVKLSIAVKIPFWILSSTVSTMLPVSLSILSLKQLSEVFTFTKLSLAVKLLPVPLTVNSWSTVPSLTRKSCSQHCQGNLFGQSQLIG